MSEITPRRNPSLDELAAHSPWPARLLGLAPWDPKLKTPAEVTREYEDEKWGPLWQQVQGEAGPVTLATINSWFEETGLEFCSQESEFVLLTATEANHTWLDLVAKQLKTWLPAPALVELGCGYGNVLLSMAKRFALDAREIIAGEFTKSGVELVNYLARQEKLRVTSGRCDLSAPGITSLPIPPDSVIYTSYATHYVRHFTPRFVEDLCSFGPRIVIHFEPCYEHTGSDSLIGLMRRRYIEINDYNRNLITVLETAEREGRIRICTQSPNVFGRNPLLPASLIAWRPVP
jgi:hypothetical protein